jgi:ABC-type bacteriocin/lantibiotic exporter with double-glycine peptidase domain
MVDPSLPLTDVQRAARLACAHDDIVGMPMGYETRLADGGASLSGGQRKRIAIARALVRMPKIVLLDEATSALDAGTERQVYRNLEELQGCATIVIAHRLSTIADSDLILVMDGGRLVESGKHRELMSRRGVYYDVVQGQADAAMPR